MILALVLLVLGIVGSAFFSGSETGFYRLNRVRLVLDGLGGDPIARGLLALTNQPPLFVATVLVGNNVANYVVSLATVMATQLVYGPQAFWPGLLAPIVLAPVLFVYGELAPKNLFYLAPNRLLRRCGPMLLVFTVLFAPAALLLWALSKLLERFAGQAPTPVQLLLARKQLQQVFDEGHEAGILSPAQRALAQGMFSLANKSVRDFMLPAGRLPTVRSDASPADVLSLAARFQCTMIPVEAPDKTATNPAGFVRTLEAHLGPKKPLQVHPVLKIRGNEPYIVALMRLEAAGKPLGIVVDESDRLAGFVTVEQLSEPLFRQK
ncbi:MAG: DUF21 domain-containing protein [Planctomycetales bacterium]|nr:DUF21 domain-containing protein [Planctomycetales bacterium]